MNSIKIKIKTDFSRTPGPRYKKEGDFSGELFRETILYPQFLEAIKTNQKVEIDLDGTSGYGTSFLEESFGGLIRVNKLNSTDILSRLIIISKEEDYLIEDIKLYLYEAKI